MKRNLILLLPIAFLVLSFKTNAESIEPVVSVTDIKILNELENSGYSLSEMLGHHKKVSSTQDLYKTVSFYKDFTDQIGKPLVHNPKNDQLPSTIPDGHGDVPNMVKAIRGFEDKGKRSDKDKKGGFFIRELANNSHYPYKVEYDGDEPRHFDIRWLYSKFAQFKLIGIVNRIDRRDFHPDFCGEVRLIYRLSYRSKSSASSLPFFLNLVRSYPKAKDCKPYAKNWLISTNSAKSLASGPLKDTSFRQLEVNFQSLRFTSGYMHDFGGQAMYMQRIFTEQNGHLLPTPLENTPHVLLLEKDKELFSRFMQFLKQPQNLKKLDDGYLNIDFDPRFLAKLSVSWSTLGRARTANRPYSKLYQTYKKDFDTIDISQLKFIKSTQGLVERLNNLTCAGCHQAGGTAGFHFLGKPDPQFSHPFNRQELGLSPHAIAEQARRKVYLSSFITGQEPHRFRPHSIQTVQSWGSPAEIPKFQAGQVGSLCFSDQKNFSGSMGCDDQPKTDCRISVGNISQEVLIGECIDASQPSAGHLCWQGDLTEFFGHPTQRQNSIETFNFYSFQDKWKLKGPLLKNLKDYKCVLPQSGAPLGRMSRPCSIEEEKFIIDVKDSIPTEICANQGGQGFDLCAASGDAGACLESKIARSMLDTCHPNKTCREDYICQRIPDYSKISVKDYARKKGKVLINKVKPSEIRGDLISQTQSLEIGFCVPTYFLFNMRVDGHPNPVSGLSPDLPKLDRSKPLRGYK